MQTLRWDDLRVLLVLMRSGSLKRGAEELDVNISTMSRRLDALEEATGLHLFDRSASGTHPTAAAEQLLPFAERMERAAIDLSQGIDALEAEPTGDVTLTAPPGIVDHFLAPALADLHKAFPHVRLRLDASIAYADLTRREADLALRLRRPRSGDLVSTRLATQGYAVIASPAYARTLGRLRDPNTARWTTWGDDLAHLPDRAWITNNVAPQNVALITSSMTAQIEAIRTGFCIGLAPRPYADLPRLTELRCTPNLRRCIATLPEGALWLVGHRAFRDVPRIAAVWDWLKSKIPG